MRPKLRRIIRFSVSADSSKATALPLSSRILREPSVPTMTNRTAQTVPLTPLIMIPTVALMLLITPTAHAAPPTVTPKIPKKAANAVKTPTTANVAPPVTAVHTATTTAVADTKPDTAPSIRNKT